jgi:hypothetical protein
MSSLQIWNKVTVADSGDAGAAAAVAWEIRTGGFLHTHTP